MITLTTNVNKAFDTSKRLAWIVKLTLDDAVRYWASENCTIESVPYVGRFILENGVDAIDSSVDISVGGGLASIGNTSLSLKEIVTQNGLHRDFKPQSAGTELLNRAVNIGCIYNFGTLADTDVVWLYSGIIDDFGYSVDSLNLDVVGVREIESIELPQKIVNATDYPKAPIESLGIPLPIVYGDFYTQIAATYNFGVDLNPTLYNYVAPAVLVDKESSKYISASHPCFSVFAYALYHDGNNKNYSVVASLTAASTFDPGVIDNDDSGYTTAVLAYGQIALTYITLFSKKGGSNNATNTFNLLDMDDTNTVTLDNATASDILALQCDSLPNGKIFDAAIIWARSAGVKSFRFGHAKEDYIFVPATPGTYVASAVTSGGDSLTSVSGINTSEFGSYQFACRCATGVESIVLNRFCLRVDLYLSAEESITNVPRGGFFDRVDNLQMVRR